MASRRSLAWVVGGLTLGVTATTAPTVATEPEPVPEPEPTVQRVDGVKPVLDRGEYYPDPYPIHKKDGWGRDLPVFGGMRMRLLAECDAGAAIKCERERRDNMTVAFAPRLEENLPDESDKCRKKKGFHPFQSNGPNPRWHLAMTVKFTDHCGTNKGKNVVFHARPREDTTYRKSVPRQWVIDKRLLGHWNRPEQKAGYNPRYYYDKPTDRLFLINIRGIKNTHPAQFAIVARRMKNFTKMLAGKKPRTLLKPGIDGHGIRSERYTRTQSGPRLVETANIRRIRGRYVMVYSTGSYKTDNYKIGLAYSDTFLPKRGGQYRKVVFKDRAGVWGAEGATEVSYLLQAQKRRAAHHTRQVKGPGVGSIVSANRKWFLFFAGYRPSERAHDGEYKPKHRTPFSLRLRISVRPKGPDHPLRSISDRELRRWIVPER